MLVLIFVTISLIKVHDDTFYIIILDFYNTWLCKNILKVLMFPRGYKNVDIEVIPF